MSKYHSDKPDRWALELFRTMQITKTEAGIPMELIYEICDRTLKALQNHNEVLIIKCVDVLPPDVQSSDDVGLWVIRKLTEIIQDTTDHPESPRVFIVEPGI